MTEIDSEVGCALVTGGAGFIGSHLVERLLAGGARRVVVVDDFSLGREDNLAEFADHEALEVLRGSCADERVLASALRAAGGAFDCCFNLAVIPLPASLERPKATVDDNVAMTTAVCELGRTGGYRRLLQYSSSEVYGTAAVVPMAEDHPLRPLTPYAASKVATDAIALSYFRTFALPVTVLRPFNTYGPRQNSAAYAGLIPTVVGNLVRGEPITVHGDGEQTRDYVYVADTVSATLALARRPAAMGSVVNFGSGRETSVNDIVQAILAATGREDWTVEHGPERPGDVRRHHADVTLARSLIAYAPEVAIADGIGRTVDWYLERAPDHVRRVAPDGSRV
jgi:UDP-glucose 4-epimerase